MPSLPLNAHPQLDLRGIPCPLSFVKAKLFLEKLTLGDVVEIWLDGGEPTEQVPDSLGMAGHKIISLAPAHHDRGEYFILMVEKA
jgi:TusA-related sulfurtransferase